MSTRGVVKIYVPSYIAEPFGASDEIHFRHYSIAFSAGMEQPRTLRIPDNEEEYR